MKELEQFFEAIKRQFTYGGEKYAHSKVKESTDVLFDTFGKNWLFGTLAKYTFRYRNKARERDLLKIACYCFIIWLKRGFHLFKTGINYEPVNTTVEIKSKYFYTFQEKAKEFVIHYLEEPIANNLLDIVYGYLKLFAQKKFQEIEEVELLNIFALCFIIWKTDVKNKGKDEDVYNEGRNKNE